MKKTEIYKEINKNKNIYKLKKYEYLIVIFKKIIKYFFIGIIFYRSIVFSVIICCISLLFIANDIKEAKEKKKRILNLQFKDFIYFVSSNLNVGKSLEYAILESEQQIKRIYVSGNSLINKEIDIMVKKLNMNQSADKVIEEFAKRSEIEDIYNFSEVIKISKRWGGNMVEICKNSCQVITEKIDIIQSINVLVSQKKLEEKILSVIPALMVTMLTFISDEYMMVLFNTFLGRSVMTVALIIFELSHLLTKKILNIKV